VLLSFHSSYMPLQAKCCKLQLTEIILWCMVLEKLLFTRLVTIFLCFLDQNFQYHVCKNPLQHRVLRQCSPFHNFTPSLFRYILLSYNPTPVSSKWSFFFYCSDPSFVCISRLLLAFCMSCISSHVCLSQG